MSNIKIYARIRPTLCWEQQFNSVQVIHDAIGVAPPYNVKIMKPIVNFHQFSHVFQQEQTNKNVFNDCLKHLCNHSATSHKNKDSVFMVYGQSTAGKTHTILGYNDNKGVLQHAIEYLLDHENILNVSIQVMESYGVKKKNMHIYDALNGANHKHGVVAINLDKYDDHLKQFVSKDINKIKQINEIVEQIKNDAHFSATARHSKSSRSHIIYCLNITRDDTLKSTSKILIVDLGGSDGYSVLTRQFAKNSHAKPLKMRKGESDVIGYGLARFQKFVSKFRKGKDLSRFQDFNKNSLRHVLYPYLSQDEKPKMNVLFCLSPSITNIKESRNTLRVAQLMGGCQVIPERCSWKRNPNHTNDNIYHQFELEWIKRGCDENPIVDNTTSDEPVIVSKPKPKPKYKKIRRGGKKNRKYYKPKVIPEENEINNNEYESADDIVIQQETKEQFNKVMYELQGALKRASSLQFNVERKDIDDELNTELDDIVQKVRESIMMKKAMDISSRQSPLVDSIDDLIDFTISPNVWSEQDEMRQKSIFDNQAAEIQNESDEDEVEQDYITLNQYRNDLKLALLAVEDDEKHIDNDDMYLNDEEMELLANKQRMKSSQTRDTIQKELDALQLAVTSSTNRLSQIKEIPVNKLRKSINNSIVYDYYEPINLWDTETSFDSTFEFTDSDEMNTDIDESDAFLVDNLFHEADEIDVDVLQDKQLQLVKYEKVLRQSLAVVKRKPLIVATTKQENVQNKLYYNDEIFYIEDELAKVMSELMDIGSKVNQLNLHNNKINEAILRDIKRASSSMPYNYISTEIPMEKAQRVSITAVTTDEQKLENIAKQHFPRSLSAPIENIQIENQRPRSQSSPAQTQTQTQINDVMDYPMPLIKPDNYEPFFPIPFNAATGWTKMYQCDDNGNRIAGNLSTLICHIASGAQIRVVINDNYAWNAANLWISDGNVYVQNIHNMLLKHPLCIGDAKNDFNFLKSDIQNRYFEVVNTKGQRHVAKYYANGYRCETKTKCNVKFFAKY